MIRSRLHGRSRVAGAQVNAGGVGSSPTDRTNMPPVSQRRDGLPEPDAGGSEAGPARCWRLLLALPGRSLAGCLVPCPFGAERDQREPECNDGSSRAKRNALRSLRTAIFCRRGFWRSGERSARIGAGLVYLPGATAIVLASLGCLNCVADWNGTEWAESV